MAVMSIEYAQKRIKELQQASEVRHLDPISIADLGGCFFTLGDVEEAYKYTKHASEIIKDAGVLMNLGLIYKELGRHAESVHCMEEAYWLNPTDNYIRLGYAEGLLKAGFWKQAWPIYTHARPTQQGAHDDLRLPKEVVEWKEGPLPVGHRVIVINEGGTGDRFSYARWLPELTRRGIDWVFFPYDELFPFFERIIPRNQLVKNGDEIVATHWTTTFSLPAVLNIGPKEIPNPLLLAALSEKVDKYKFKRIDKYPAVGLCWSAAELFQGGRKVRSMTEGQVMRLVCSTSDIIHYVNLQYGIKMPQPVINVKINDWEDTAGLIANLDGVVSVDTGVMHLSGAMQKKMATLLSGNSCWKFLNHTKQCPWYPTATLFRNEGAGFENAIDKTISAIRNECFFPERAGHP
jgi:tetratricopeptide (TPR) repeat protein